MLLKGSKDVMNGPSVSFQYFLHRLHFLIHRLSHFLVVVRDLGLTGALEWLTDEHLYLFHPSREGTTPERPHPSLTC